MGNLKGASLGGGGGGNVTHSIETLTCFADIHLMLSVTNQSIILSVVMLIVIMLIVIMLSVVMLSVVMVSVIMVSVVAPSMLPSHSLFEFVLIRLKLGKTI